MSEPKITEGSEQKNKWPQNDGRTNPRNKGFVSYDQVDESL